MRRLLFVLLSVSLLNLLTVSAQESKDKPKIEGSGKIITRDVPVQGFDQLDITGVFSVHLTQGNAEGVKIEADDNLQDLFEVKNEGSKLIVSMKKDTRFESKKKLKVYVSFKSIKSMDLKTVGDVSSEKSMSFEDLKLENKSVGSLNFKLTANTLNVDNKSVGDVTLSGKAQSAIIKNKSVGSINAGSFVVQTMEIDNNGVGSAEVNAEKELKVKDSFLGKVTNKGSAEAKRTKNVKI